MNIQFKAGDRISWTYRHYTNSRSSFLTSKHGDYIGKVKHTVIHWRKMDATQMCFVQFDGNKRPSCVPVSEIRLSNIMKSYKNGDKTSEVTGSITTE